MFFLCGLVSVFALLYSIAFISSNRGAKHLVIEDHVFKVNRKEIGLVYWRCTHSRNSRCKSVCQTSGTDESSTIIKGPTQHNHESQGEFAIEMKRMKGRIIKRSLTDTATLLKIYLAELNKSIESTQARINSSNQQYVPKLKNFEAAIYKRRNLINHKNPKTIDEIDLARSEFNLTANGLRHLLFDKKENKQRMICYASDQQLQILSECDRWHCDGTFRSASLFYQLYIIYGFRNGEMHPCAYFYTEKKSEAVYTQMLKDLMGYSAEMGFILAPKVVMTDFELAFIKAWKKVFPETVHYGCHFHFTQCLARHVQLLGLEAAYELKGQAYDWLRLFSAIPLVPEAFVPEVFEYIASTVPKTEDLDKNLQEFLKYFKSTWIEKNELSSILNLYMNEGPRTSNHVEGQNAALNRFIAKSRPSITDSILALRAFECQTVLRYCACINNNSHAKNRRNENIQRDLVIQKLKSRLERAQLTVIEYVEAVSRLFQIKKSKSEEQPDRPEKPIERIPIENRETLLLDTFRAIDYESKTIKALINANAEDIESDIAKCKLHVMPTYCGQVKVKDLIVKSLVCKHTKNAQSTFEAVKTTGDGSCLYNAVSISLFGNERFSQKLRIASIYTILKHEEYFAEILASTGGCTLSTLGEKIASLQWGDDVVAIALSMIIQRPIALLRPQAGAHLSFARRSDLAQLPVYICLYASHFTALV
jgi:hypothetical protein